MLFAAQYLRQCSSNNANNDMMGVVCLSVHSYILEDMLCAANFKKIVVVIVFTTTVVVDYNIIFYLFVGQCYNLLANLLVGIWTRSKTNQPQSAFNTLLHMLSQTKLEV
jgi:hypothetical protein